MRPTSAIWLVAGLVVALAGVALTIVAFLADHGGKPWHYWMAPVLSVGFAVLLIVLAIGYYLRVGRLEIKERSRSE